MSDTTDAKPDLRIISSEDFSDYLQLLTGRGLFESKGCFFIVSPDKSFLDTVTKALRSADIDSEYAYFPVLHPNQFTVIKADENTLSKLEKNFNVMKVDTFAATYPARPQPPASATSAAAPAEIALRL